jgi:hypothetical protein
MDLNELVKTRFKEAGFQLLSLYTDDGAVEVTVTPDVASLARRFSSKRNLIQDIVDSAKFSPRLEIRMQSDFSSLDLDGSNLDIDFAFFVRDQARATHDAITREIEADFAMDASDHEGTARAHL